MSSIKANTELLTDPLKMQTFRLQEMLIKEQKNKYKLMFISFLSGLVATGLGVLITNIQTKHPKEIDVQEILHTVSSQADLIQSLTTENTNLKLTLKNLKVSSDIKN